MSPIPLYEATSVSKEKNGGSINNDSLALQTGNIKSTETKEKVTSSTTGSQEEKIPSKALKENVNSDKDKLPKEKTEKTSSRNDLNNKTATKGSFSYKRSCS